MSAISKIPTSKYPSPILSTRERSALFFLMITSVALIALGTFETLPLEFTAALYASGGVLLSGTIAWYLATVKRRKTLPKVGCPEITFPLGEKILILANQIELQTLYEELSKNLHDDWKKEVASWKDKNPYAKTFPEAEFDAFYKKMLEAFGKSHTEHTHKLSKLKDPVNNTDGNTQKVSKEKNAANSRIANLLLKIRNIVCQSEIFRQERDSENNLTCGSTKDMLFEVRSLLKKYPWNSAMALDVMEKVIELACQYAHCDLLQILVDRRLITDNGYQKGIRCAAEHNATDCCQLLLRTKGDLQIERNFGFIHAIENGNLNLVHAFVQYGASLTYNFEFLQSPLHYAVEGLHVDIVQFLLSKGANPQSSSGLVKTPLQMLNSERVQTLVRNNPQKQHAFQKIQELLTKR